MRDIREEIEASRAVSKLAFETVKKLQKICKKHGYSFDADAERVLIQYINYRAYAARMREKGVETKRKEHINGGSYAVY